MGTKWVRMGFIGSINCNEAESNMDHSKTSHGTWRAGIRTSFIPEVLHDSPSAATAAEMARGFERHAPGPRRAYADGLYVEVELPDEPGERPGTVMTVTTGACFVNRCTPDAGGV